MEVTKDLYQFVPAAIFPKFHCATGIYVKYHSLRDTPPHIKLYTPQHLWIDTPDRELILVNDSTHVGNLRPLNENYDEFVSLSPLHYTSNDMSLKWGMVNYTQNTSPQYDFNYMDAYKHLPPGKRKFKIMSDSGGFQLGRGSISFINPRELAYWYSKNVDVGMALDIPIGAAGSREFLKQSSIIQRDNTNAMLDVLHAEKSKTSIMNIIHGGNNEEQRRYHETIYNPKLKSLAIAGMYHRSIVDAVRVVYNLLHSDIGDMYNHIHVLGVFNNKILPVYIWLFKMLNERKGKEHKLMTSDASTAIQQALARTFLLSADYDEPYYYQKLGLVCQDGHMPSRKIPSSFRTLNCCCPVCAAIKYTDVFTFFRGRPISDILTVHNMWQMTHYADYMNQMAMSLTFKDYLDLLNRQIGKRASRDTIDAMNFMHYADKHGSEEASKRFYIYFTKFTQQSFSGGLFGDNEAESKQEAKTTKLKRDDYLRNLFKRYTLYHKKGIAPKMVKIELDKKVGNLALRSKSIHRSKKRIKRRA